MRAQDIVNHIATYLPETVDDFTNNSDISMLTSVGSTVTAVTSTVHGLAVGDKVNITGASTPIEAVTITRSGMLASLETATDHDFTEFNGATIVIQGAVEPEFNGTFDILGVPNRRNVTFKIDDSGPLTATGSPLVLNGANIFNSYNGLREVTAVPSATSFEYQLSVASLYSPALGSPIARSNPRISAAVDFESLMSAYTKQGVGDAWLFVVLADSVASKNRNIDIDAVDNIQQGNYFNQRLIQTIQFFVFLPTSAEIAGRQARDRCEELLNPICSSVLGVRFPSLVENDNNPLMITGHGAQAYNSAFYVHQYAFEATLQLGPSDIFVPRGDVAFRDLEFTTGLQVGTETFDTFVDLDEEPLV